MQRYLLALVFMAAPLAVGWGGAVDVNGLASAQPPKRSCEPEPAEQSIVAFLKGASGADADALSASIAKPSAFIVFSTGFSYGSGRPDRFFVTKHRGALIRKLLARQSRGDRYELLELDLNGYEKERQLCHFGFEINRRIGNGPWRPFGGKGTLDANSGTVSLWNVGGEIKALQRFSP